MVPIKKRAGSFPFIQPNPPFIFLVVSSFNCGKSKLHSVVPLGGIIRACGLVVSRALFSASSDIAYYVDMI